MKKTIFTLALLTGLASTAQAQRSNVSLGIKAGGSLTNFVGADSGGSFGVFGTPGRAGYTNLFGFHAGVFANLGITKMVAFQPELLYSQKGATLNKSVSRLHYVDVPLAFHINAKGLFFEAGPQVGVLTGAKLKINGTSFDVKDEYNDVDFGYLAGLGYQHKQGLGIGLRYNGAFTNVRRAIDLSNSTTFQERSRNSALQLYLTYSLNGR